MKVWLKEIAFVLLSVSVFSGCSIITNGINYKRDKLMDRTRYTLQQSFITGSVIWEP